MELFLLLLAWQDLRPQEPARGLSSHPKNNQLLITAVSDWPIHVGGPITRKLQLRFSLFFITFSRLTELVPFS